ncbi:MAG: class I SAM-dependent methyltransferase [Actinobacteria bacterium]|nr:class I SAM-dependent methyltransferase [Actinomycetota bacterium]MBU2686448.1 class I SAM-dependent methyltransferase [Actinomycetota bacterium]
MRSLLERDLIGQRFTGRHAFLCEMAGDLTGASTLDIGCGFGWFERYTLEHGATRAVGLELSEPLVERAGEEAPGAEFLHRDASGDLSDLGSFTVLCLFDVLEHLPKGSEVAVLRRLRAALEPGGRLLLSTPFNSLLSRILDPAWYLGHRHYSRERLEAILAEAGFEARRVRFAGGAVEQFTMIWLYLWKWLFRREMPFAGPLERARAREYAAHSATPSLKACVTIFAEAVASAG